MKDYLSNQSMDKVFIWTEAFNCGEILTPMLSSYIKHNSNRIYVFGTKSDLEKVEITSPQIVLASIDELNTCESPNFERKILKSYKKGHKGTSKLWSYLIKFRPEQFFLHIDADTIFLGDTTSILVEAVASGKFALAGSRRPYFNRPYRKSGIDGWLLDRLPDTVNTDCFAFDKSYINTFPFWNLNRKIVGKRPLRNPVIDFFDPITFEIIRKNGKVLYVDSPDQGDIGIVNWESDFHTKRISFAAVGSGVNFFKNPHIKVPTGYRDFALSSYSLYSHYLLRKDIGLHMHNDENMIRKLSRLNTETWSLD